jgi:hypothetical protein
LAFEPAIATTLQRLLVGVAEAKNVRLLPCEDTARAMQRASQQALVASRDIEAAKRDIQGMVASLGEALATSMNPTGTYGVLSVL